MINTSFLRLVRVHALAAAGDAMITVALAGSLFFSIDPSAARVRIALYLLLTMAPFAVVGPLVGPAMDRFKSGRRTVISTINFGRAVVAFLMISNLDSLLLFPIAFLMLVLQKSYGVAKASMVPLILSNEEQFVGGNSRLALVGGICGFVGAGPAVLTNWLGGSSWTVSLAMVLYLLAALSSLSLTTAQPKIDQTITSQAQLVQSTDIRRAAAATGTLRGMVGFMTFLAAFGLRGGTDDVDLSGIGKAFGAGVRHALQGDVASDASPVWKLGLVAMVTVVGFLAGSLLAPQLRYRIREEKIIAAALLTLLCMGSFTAWTGGFSSMLFLALSLGVAASTAKLSFDSIVQRDAENANHGRAFAAFETRFQIFWVLGALLPVIITIPVRLGYLLIGVVAAVSVALFWLHRSPSLLDQSEPTTDRVPQPQQE
ncbi:MAG: MFS transporter [Acidimicrobiia bacterium]|nr:MFS transporter [Acidimicrobiia bacterium]